MTEIDIRVIKKQHETDINIPNEPFNLVGKMIPTYQNQKWDYSVDYQDEIETMCFPDENYDYDSMSKESTFIGAYDGDKCIGLAIIQEAFFKYMYLYDLKVKKEYRGHQVAEKLIAKAREIAKEKNYIGIYTQGQDNNVIACLFYLKVGFVIGGLDTLVYNGTPQENKSDILFYLTF